MVEGIERGIEKYLLGVVSTDMLPQEQTGIFTSPRTGEMGCLLSVYTGRNKTGNMLMDITISTKDKMFLKTEMEIGMFNPGVSILLEFHNLYPGPILSLRYLPIPQLNLPQFLLAS